MAIKLRRIPKLFITSMRSEDIPAVMQVERECFATPWSEASYRTELTNQCAEYYVAWINGALVGYVGMWLIMDVVHITTIGVAEHCRGNKVGERLLVRLLDASKERGAQRVTLEVRKSNLVAQNLYEKYGFRAAAIRKNYYSDNQEDAVIMWVDDLWNESWVRAFEHNKTALEALEEV